MTRTTHDKKCDIYYVTKKKRPRIGLFDIVVITLAIHDEESKAVDAYMSLNQKDI